MSKEEKIREIAELLQELNNLKGKVTERQYLEEKSEVERKISLLR